MKRWINKILLAAGWVDFKFFIDFKMKKCFVYFFQDF